jgi:hypothetical protein
MNGAAAGLGKLPVCLHIEVAGLRVGVSIDLAPDTGQLPEGSSPGVAVSPCQELTPSPGQPAIDPPGPILTSLDARAGHRGHPLSGTARSN